MNYDAVESFKNKCGRDIDIFINPRYSLPGKGDLLSRVAVYAAIHDVFKCHYNLTPGQITTVVDASSIIVGQKVCRSLNDVETFKQLEQIIEKNARTWERGIIYGSQLWSLFYKSQGEFPDQMFKNSIVSDDEHRIYTLASACFESRRHIDMSNSAALLDSIKAASPHIPKEFMHEVKENGITFEKAISSSLATVIKGMDEHYEEFRKTSLDRNKDCNFLGPIETSQLQNMHFIGRGHQEPFNSFVGRLPYGPFLLAYTHGYQQSHQICNHEDLISSTMDGYFIALEKYTPLIVEKQTVHDVSKEPLELLNNAGVSLENTKLFNCSRFSGFALKTYIPKKAMEYTENVCQELKIDPEISKAISIIRKKAILIKGEEDEEDALMTWKEAVETAVKVIIDENPTTDKDIFNTAKLVTISGQNIKASSMDAEINDGDRTIGDTIGVDPEMYSDDDREEWGRDPQASLLLGDNQETASGMVVISLNNSVSAEKSMTSQFKFIYDEVADSGNKVLIRHFNNLASEASLPSDIEIQLLAKEVTKICGKNNGQAIINAAISLKKSPILPGMDDTKHPGIKLGLRIYSSLKQQLGGDLVDSHRI